MSGPSLNLGSMFPDSDDEEAVSSAVTDEMLNEEGETKQIVLAPGHPPISIREFAFHSHNANFVWKGNEEFAQWMLRNPHHFEQKRILELACGTGILTIFMKLQGWDVTSSDYNDEVINMNMQHNVIANGLNAESIPHLPYCWGNPFPSSAGIFDVIIANDILIYESTYPLLTKSIKEILGLHPNATDSPNSCSAPHFFLGHKRRVKASPSFFDIAQDCGLYWRKIDNYIYDFTLLPPNAT